MIHRLVLSALFFGSSISHMLPPDWLSTPSTTTEEGRIEKRQIDQTCQALMVTSGTVNYIQANPSTPYSQGTTATLTCPSGAVNGATSTTCQSGIWTPPLGTCDGSSPFGSFGGSVPSSTNGGIGGSVPNTPIGGGLPGSNGFGASPLGVPSTGTTGQLQCLDMLTPLNGIIKYSSTAGLHQSGSTATLTCNSGFVPSGQTTATCQNGVWSPATFEPCSGSVPPGK